MLHSGLPISHKSDKKGNRRNSLTSSQAVRELSLRSSDSSAIKNCTPADETRLFPCKASDLMPPTHSLMLETSGIRLKDKLSRCNCRHRSRGGILDSKLCDKFSVAMSSPFTPSSLPSSLIKLWLRSSRLSLGHPVSSRISGPA